ncbi:MAG: HD domain-containing protein [Candidatus Promineifilaceae bacterium]
MIEYQDMIYGTVQIEEPVILAVMDSAAMWRLDGVLQHGISGLIGLTPPITRREHSIGAMLLVRRLGASVQEQLAALLHDVSHTAFSHVIDYVFHGHNSQSYHDEMKASYLSGTDAPAVLAEYGFDWSDFLDEGRYPLLEQPSPALCADRLDYFLRDGPGLGLMDVEQIQWALSHLIVHNGRIGVDDTAVATWLGDTYMAADQASWANFKEVGLYELTAQAIRIALEKEFLVEDDIWGTDEPAWTKLQAAPEPKIQELISLIRPETQFVWDEEAPDFRISTKLRTIDPDVLIDGTFHPLSTLDPEYGRRRMHYLNTRSGKWPMRVIR